MVANPGERPPICGAAHPRNEGPHAVYFTGDKRVLSTDEGALFCTEALGHSGPHRASEPSGVVGNLVWDHSWEDSICDD